MTWKNKTKGFTLIETMTALAILAIALVVLLGLRNRDIALSAEASHIIRATLLARQKLTELALAKEAPSETERGDFGEIEKDYRWELEVQPTPLPEVTELTVKVFWRNEGREGHVQFTKFLFANR